LVDAEDVAAPEKYSASFLDLTFLRLLSGPRSLDELPEPSRMSACDKRRCHPAERAVLESAVFHLAAPRVLRAAPGANARRL